MSLSHAEKSLLPHAVYHMFNRSMELLYVGCSYGLCSRLAGHGTGTPWITEVAAIKVLWYPDEITGRRAEAEAILTKKPKYNRVVIEPDAVGTKEMHQHEARPRGDGLHCPKCGKPKERRTAAYCNECYRGYAHEKKLRRAAKA